MIRNIFQPRTRGTALSPGEEIELTQLKFAKVGAGPEPDYFPARDAYREATTGFAPTLMSEPRDILDALPVWHLISEITHAKRQLREERRRPPGVPYTEYEPNTATLDLWQAHLDALKAEFDRRRDIRAHLGELDRLRLEVAYAGVVSVSNEWPSPHTVNKSSVTEPVAAENTADIGTGGGATGFTRAGDIANSLQSRLFDLYDRANRPDIEWTEDGPVYGGTYHDADDPELAQNIRELENELDEHIAAHRDELSADPRWAEQARAENYYSGSSDTSVDGENTEVEDEIEESEQ